jgi:lactate dehydrogenase-like 2-hydroxyacid dehydrogenase
MSMGHVYVSRRLPALAEAELRKLDLTVVHHDDEADPPTREELLAGLRGASAAIVLLTERIDEEALEAAGPGMRCISTMSVGFDNIDVRAATQRGVTVANTPGVLDEATADLAFGLMLAVTRRIVEADRFVRTGEPWTWSPVGFVGLDVSAGRTLGIVGLGRTGMAVARRARAFGMTVIASGSAASSPEAMALGVAPASVDEVIRSCDVLSLHCPLTDDTRGMISRGALASMRKGSFLINIARGPLVDEEALADALESGHLRGAGLDVHEQEPTVNPRLLDLDQVVVLPHIGSAGDHTREQMAVLAVRNVASLLTHGVPLNSVNRD